MYKMYMYVKQLNSKWTCMSYKQNKKKKGIQHFCFIVVSSANVCANLYSLTLCMLVKNFSRRRFEIFILFFLENRI